MTARFPHLPGPFTAAQITVIELAGEGLTTDDIALKLGVSPHAVRDRFERARKRIGAHTATELVHHAWCHGQLGDRSDLLATIAQLRGERDMLRLQLHGGRVRAA